MCLLQEWTNGDGRVIGITCNFGLRKKDKNKKDAKTILLYRDEWVRKKKKKASWNAPSVTGMFLIRSILPLASGRYIQSHTNIQNKLYKVPS